MKNTMKGLVATVIAIIVFSVAAHAQAGTPLGDTGIVNKICDWVKDNWQEIKTIATTWWYAGR